MEKKMRNSVTRNTIYEYLCVTKAHPSAEMIYLDLKESNPNLSLGTVYRNLKQLEEIGKVIRTKPKKGTKIEAGSLIEIFVATSEEIEPVEVPNLVGMTVSEAIAALEEVGLVLDSSRTEYRPSSSPANTIIGHELIGEMALPGTSLAVFVSTGRPPETTEEESTDEDESTEEEKTTKPTTTKKRETTVPPVSTTAPSTKPSSTEPSTEPSTLPSTAPSTQPTEPVTQPSSQPTQPTEAPDAPEFVEGEE